MGNPPWSEVSTAQKFKGLFAGLESAYGIFNINQTRDDGKKLGKVATKRESVTEELWEKHVAGTQSLGIVPIREDNTCFFGAIDVDVYPIDHREIASRLKKFNIPLVVCRTKSGGAHLYCFAMTAVPASKMKGKLSEIAGFLGYGKSEIFPKQVEILVSQGDVGQWINMPYFGGLKGLRYAVDTTGNALSIDEFFDVASASVVKPEWFDEQLVIPKEFPDGPPCLQALAQLGYPDGTRNDGLYNIGVYVKKAFPDTWKNELELCNSKFMSPPLTSTEVQGVAKSLDKKEYGYACNKQPIAAHCNAALCRTKKYGVGSGGTTRFPSLGGLSKLDTNPPIWFWTVDGVRMELTTKELQDPRAFQAKCMDYLNIMTMIPKAEIWAAAVQHALDSVVVIEAPKEASPEGQFWELVEKFCSGRAQALSIDEIVLGKPYNEDGLVSFRMADLDAFLKRQKFTILTSQKIASILRDSGATHSFKNLKGRGTNFWTMAGFNHQTEKLEIPKQVDGEEDVF